MEIVVLMEIVVVVVVVLLLLLLVIMEMTTNTRITQILWPISVLRLWISEALTQAGS